MSPSKRVKMVIMTTSNGKEIKNSCPWIASNKTVQMSIVLGRVPGLQHSIPENMVIPAQPLWVIPERNVCRDSLSTLGNNFKERLHKNPVAYEASSSSSFWSPFQVTQRVVDVHWHVHTTGVVSCQAGALCLYSGRDNATRSRGWIGGRLCRDWESGGVLWVDGFPGVLAASVAPRWAEVSTWV